MKRRIATILILAAAVQSAAAADVARPSAETDEATPDAASETMLAFRIAAWARAHRDPRALLVAARILGEVPGGDAGAPAAPLPTTRDGLLAEARELARGDPAILAQAASIAAAEGKGASRGPRRWATEIPAGGIWTLRFQARGGELLYVLALGDGDAALGLELRDSADRLVCENRGRPEVDCRTNPTSSEPYSAHIFNRGSIATRTLAVSN